MIKCPLCKSNDIRLLQVIYSKQLKSLYINTLGINIDRLVGKKDISFFLCNVCHLKYFYPSIGGDSDFYNLLNKKFDWYYLNDKEEFRIISKYIGNDNSILEIGSGEGKYCDYLLNKSHKKVKYIGLELNADAVRKGAENGINIKNEPIEYFSKKNHSKFDVVVSIQVLEHVSNPGDFLVSAFSCLKYGGKLIVSVPSDDSFVGVTVNSTLNMPPHHQSRWSDNTLKYVSNLLNTDFPIIIHESVSDYHKAWFFRQKILCHIFGNREIAYTNNIFYTFFSFICYPISILLVKIFHLSKKTYGHSVIAVFQKKI